MRTKKFIDSLQNTACGERKKCRGRGTFRSRCRGYRRRRCGVRASLLPIRRVFHVLAEAVASTDVCGLDGEDKVFAVRTAEERHQALLPGESFVDEKILLVVAHRVSEIHGLDAPAMPLKLLDDIVVELCGKLMGERRKVRDGRRHTGIAPVAVARLSALSFIRLS